MGSDAKRSGDSRRPSPMSGSSGSCRWSCRGNKRGLHEDGTGRQLDFSSKYYRLWLSYLYYYRKNYGSMREAMRCTCGSNRNEVSGNQVNTKE